MSWMTDLQGLLTEHYQGKIKVDQLTGLTAVESLIDSQEELQKNRDAESAAVRKQLWGSDESEGSQGEDMRQTVLGDIVTNNTTAAPTQPAPAKQSSLLPLATAALIGAMPASAMMVYNAANQPVAPEPVPIVQPDYTGETVQIGLSKLDPSEIDQ